MAWRRRGKQMYYYRSVREGGRVKCVYYGTGKVGQLAAAADALRRAELEARRAIKAKRDTAVTLTHELGQVCALVVEATLLAAGYHRPQRHTWRVWIRGRRELDYADRA